MTISHDNIISNTMRTRDKIQTSRQYFYFEFMLLDTPLDYSTLLLVSVITIDNIMSAIICGNRKLCSTHTLTRNAKGKHSLLT